MVRPSLPQPPSTLTRTGNRTQSHTHAPAPAQTQAPLDHAASSQHMHVRGPSFVYASPRRGMPLWRPCMQVFSIRRGLSLLCTFQLEDWQIVRRRRYKVLPQTRADV